MTCAWCFGPHATEACPVGAPSWHDLPLGYYTLLDGSGRERVELVAVDVEARLRWPSVARTMLAWVLGRSIGPELRVTVLLRYQTPALPGRTLTTSPLVWSARKPIYLGASYRVREPVAGEVLA